MSLETPTGMVDSEGFDGETSPTWEVRCLIGVASGKGGVGKSTVAVNLAMAFSESGARTGLLDLDMYGPSAPTMMGIRGGRMKMDGEDRILPLEAHGVKLVSIGFMVADGDALIWRGAILDKVVKDFVNNVKWGGLDYLVVDLPPGTGDIPLSLTRAVSLHGVVLVTTPQEVAVVDVVRCFALYQEVHVPVLGLVENMSTLVCPHCQGRVDLFTPGGGRDMSRSLNIPLLGQIPFDMAIGVGGDLGLPLLLAEPRSPSAEVFRQIAHGLMDRLRNVSTAI